MGNRLRKFLMTTQKDIAARLGVSVSLVSRALSGKAGAIGATPETIRRIQRTAAEMNYVPSAAARVLKGAPTQTIGVVVYDFEDPFFSPIIGALQREAHARRHSLVLVGFERRHVDENDLQPLIKHGVDGLIIVGSEPALPWAQPFLDQGARVARIGGGPSVGPVRVVSIDTAHALDTALRHLADLGHTRIGFLGADTPTHRFRRDLFREHLRRRGLEDNPRWIVLSPAGGAEACAQLLEQGGDRLPTALMTSSDITALGAMRFLWSQALRIPEDISVVGFDDIPLARLSTPGLTTLKQPVSDMARKAFDCVLAEEPVVTETFKTTLIIRESTQRPPSP